MLFFLIWNTPLVSQAQCDIGGIVIHVPIFPYNQTGISTCGAGNNLSGENTIPCINSGYLNGDDLVFVFSVPVDSLYHIEFTNATENWTSLLLYEGCPLIGEEGVCVTSQGDSNDKLLSVELEANTDYYLVVSRWYEDCFEFDLSIDYPLNCPEAGTPGWETISLPFEQTSLTVCDMGEDFMPINTTSCGSGNYLNSEEIVYIFEAPTTDYYHFSLTNVSESWSSMKLYDGCPYLEQEGSCISNTASSAGNKIMGVNLEEGQTYYLIISRYYGGCFNFDLSIDIPVSCPEPGTPGWETITLPFAGAELTTCGMGDDFQSFTINSCGSANYVNSEDLVYIFEAPTTDFYHFTLENATDSWTSMKLYDGCPYLDQEGACVSHVANSSSGKIMEVDLVEGQTYYLIISRYYGGCFDFDLTINVPETCPEPGSTGWPEISLPFAETNLTTCGMGDDLQSFTAINCGSNSYYSGEEVVFIFEAPATDFYHFSLTNTSTSWTSLKLHDGCPLLNHETSCVGSSTSSGDHILEADLEEGQIYYLMVSNSGDNCFDFDLTINVPETCPEPGSTGWPEISLPFAETNLTTCGMGDDLQSFTAINCGSNSYYSGEEVVFIFEAPATDFYHFSLTNTSTSWTSLKLHDGCPLLNHETSCVGSSTSSGDHILEADLEEGQIYYLMVSNSGDSCFDFDLSILVPQECPEPGEPGWAPITLPFAEQNLTTCGMGDDLQAYNTINCGSSSYFNGEEMVYIFEATASDTWYFTLANTTANWTSLKLYDGCPLLGYETQCIASVSGLDAGKLLEADLEEGQIYYLIINSSGTDCFDFDLVIDLYPVLSCPDDMEICPNELLVLDMIQPQGGIYSGEGIYYDEDLEAYVFDPQGKEGENIDVLYEFGGFSESSCAFVVMVKEYFEPETPLATLPENESSVSSPVSFEWEISEHAEAYDLYLWRSTQEKPSSPTVRNISATTYEHSPYLNTNYLYHWQIVAKNSCYAVYGEVQSFSFLPLPDLVVSELNIPGSAVAGSEIEISYTVTNQGEGISGWMPWQDRFFLSENQDWNAGEAILLTSLENQDYLEAGESYSHTFSLETPYDLEGSFYLFAFTDATNVVSETDDENNILVAAEPMNISFPPYPDLEVTNVNSSSESMVPGENFNVSWTVENIGDAPAEGGWTQRVSIIQNAESRLLTHVQTSETLAEGGIISENISITIPQILQWEGDVHLKLELIPNPELVEKPHSEENNTAVSEDPIFIEKQLFLKASSNLLVLGEEESLRVTLSRSGKVDDVLNVNLSASETGIIDFPESVIIPGNQSSVHFFVDALTENMDDYELELILLAEATEHNSAEKAIIVQDAQLPALNLTAESNTVVKGETMEFTLTRSGNINQEFAASFISSKPNITDIPTYVMMAAGETAVSFEILFSETQAVEVHQDIKITALSNGYTAGEKHVELTDPDLPQASLEANPSVLSPTAGDFASWANITLTNPAKENFTYYISASPQGILNLPSSITIAPSEWETEFSIGVAAGLDKFDLQDVEISLQLYLESCQCLVPAHILAPTTSEVSLTDSSLPSLALHASPQIVAAGTENAGILEISIMESHSEDLPVSVSVNKEDVILISESVVIPAGALSAELEFETLEMMEDEVSERLSVLAAADDFQTASTWLMVSNRNLPDLVISSLDLSASSINAEESVELSLEIANNGLGTAAPGTDIAIYLSDHPDMGSGMLQVFLQTHEPILAGESITLVETLSFPSRMGMVYLWAEVNTQKNIHELIYANNTSPSQPLSILPEYNAFASVSESVFDPGTPIEITGYVRYQNNEPAPEKDVDVYIVVKGVRRALRATSDENGDFSVTFYPAPGEGGDYFAGAAFPGHLLNDPQAEFAIPAFRHTGAEPQWNLTQEEPYSGSLAVKNLSSIDLSSVSLEVLSAPEGIEIDATPIPSLPGNGTAEISYTITSYEVSEQEEYEKIRLRLTSSQGASFHIDGWVHTKSEEAYLTAYPTSLQTTVLQGHGNIRELTISNIGEAETGQIHIQLPDVDWITCISSDTLNNILPGASAVFTLRVNPGADVPLNVPVTGTIGVAAENATALDVPFSFEPVSENTGSIWVRVANEYTYNTEEAPYLQGATVLLRHLYTGQIIGEDLTNGAGIVTMDNIAEGYYQLWVYKEQHETYVNTVFINMGEQNEFEVLISYQAISYFWDVIPTLIEDEYEINLIAEFETHVPVPVVVMDAPDDIPDLGPGEFFPFVVTLTNYGLITANNVRIRFADDDRYIVNYLFDEMDLPAQSSVQIPVILEANTEIKSTKSDNCWYYIEVPYEYECGPFTNTGYARKWYYIGGPGCTGNTGGRPPGATGTAGGGSFNSNPPNLVGYFAGCDCAFEQIEWIVSCGLCNIPPMGALCVPYNIYNCVSGLVDGCISNASYTGCVENMIRCDPNPVTQAAFCLYDLVDNPCLLGSPPPGDDNGDGGNGGNPDHPDDKHIARNDCNLDPVTQKTLKSLNSQAEILLELQEISTSWAYEVYGDSVWFEAPKAELQFFFDYLDTQDSENHIVISDELIQSAPSNISLAQLQAFIDRRNNSLDLENDLPYDESNVVNFELIDSHINRISELETMVQDMGYESVSEMKVALFEVLHATFSGGFAYSGKEIPQKHVKSGGTVCARVTLQFSQTLTMTREAFEGNLTLLNSNETDAIEDIQLTLNITDLDGNNSNHLFEITTLSLDGISGIDGGGVIDANGEGRAKIQFIPTRDAAPQIPKSYNFGGMLSYRDPFSGEMVHETLAPVTLLVSPSPDLHIDYFMQRDILGNDPLTNVIEPSIPAELAVMIHNRGAGLARDVSIESAQPEIIDNEKGLLIDFEIVGSNLSGQPTELGINNIDFGDLESDEIAIGQWWFTSSLLGHFVDYEVSVTHLNSFDNPDLALITRVDVHELIRSVYAYGDFDDGIDDFLVNDMPDYYDTPDLIFYSHGGSDPVSEAESGQIEGDLSPQELTIELSVDPSESGWNYLRLPDPGNGHYEIVSCTREDQQEIPLKNVWLTHVRIPTGIPPIYENHLHLLDWFETGEPWTYTLTFALKEMNGPSIVEINGVPEGVIDYPLQSLEVVFNKAIDPSTFTYEDLVLRNQGQDNIADSLIQITALSEHTYQLDLSEKTTEDGLYSLIVQAAGIADPFGNLGEIGEQVFWIQGVNLPAVVRFFGYPVQSQHALDTMMVYFNMPIDPNTFTHSQLEFKQVEGEVYPSESLSIIQVDDIGRLFKVEGLQAYNQSEAVYELIVKVTEITGESGENGFMDQSVRWRIGETSDVLVDAGPDGVICADASYTLEAASTSSLFFNWEGGDGVFEMIDELMVYTPGEQDVLAGSVDLCLTATDEFGVELMTDCMTLTIHPLPEIQCPEYESICQSTEFFSFEELAGVVTHLNGDTISGFEPSESGLYEFTYWVSSAEGCVNSCHFEIMVDPLPLTAGEISGPAEVCLNDGPFVYSVDEAEYATSYLWILPDGTEVETETNTVQIQFSAANTSAELSVTALNDCGQGESSVLELIIHPVPDTPVISLQDGNILLSDAPEGNQWYNADGMIEGATEPELLVTEDGEYYVIVTLEGCVSEMSNTIEVIITGILDLMQSETMRAYPNPFSEELILTNPAGDTKIRYQIHNANGSLMDSGTFEDQKVIKTENYPPGMYLIRFSNGESLHFQKLIRE